MHFEIGQRVIFRSLHWEVADNASEAHVELFGRSHENQGRTVRVVLGLEPVEPAQVPPWPGRWIVTWITLPGKHCTTLTV